MMSGFSGFASGALSFTTFSFLSCLVQFELTSGFSFVTAGWYADSTTTRLYDWHD
jgi:hypothetical protein